MSILRFYVTVNTFFSLREILFIKFVISGCLASRDLSIGAIPTLRFWLFTEKTWLTVDWILEKSIFCPLYVPCSFHNMTLTVGCLRLWWNYVNFTFFYYSQPKFVDCGLIFGKSMFYHIDSPCGFHNVILTVGFLWFSRNCANVAFLFYSQPIFLAPWDYFHKVCNI